MQNMNYFDGHIQTQFGIFGGVSSYDVYDTGELKSIIFSDKNMLVTHVGELVPAFTETQRRKYKPSIEFYRSGTVKSVALEEQQELITPIGEFPAELVTFYETGEMKRIFPLDGKISGFWGEEEERELCIPFNFDLGFSSFTARIGNICFYQDGSLKSFTLFPGETVKIDTLYGEISGRNGFAMYYSGALKSCEPELPVLINTPVGKIMAYDSGAVGINADENSLCFYEDGKLASLTTVFNRIGVQTADEEFIMFSPARIANGDEEAQEEIKGLKIDFFEEGVRFNGEKKLFPYASTGFSVLQFDNGVSICNPSDCANCSLCKN